MRPRDEQEGLSNQHQEYPGDHGIADVALRAGYYEVPGWVPRGQGPATLRYETTETRGEQQESDPRTGGQADCVSTREPYRDDDRRGEWQDGNGESCRKIQVIVSTPTASVYPPEIEV